MWLINTITLQLEEVTDAGLEGKSYAILSHCWEEGQEVSFQEFNHPDLEEVRQKRGFEKIRRTCERAKREDPPLQYCWVDTCCIDKKSSAELTEAINSMFKWYREATVCYAYLHDLQHGNDLKSQLPECKYFTRGWTLQELIAPREMVFFDADWVPRGTKKELLQLLCTITNIPEYVLTVGDEVHNVCIARRMSWAAHRQTRRIEDEAYCLMGIFGIHMPMIYGEGRQAFVRLQEELINDSRDRSIFAWKSSSDESYRGLLARSPREYAHCGNYSASLAAHRLTGDYQLMNGGINFHSNISIISEEGKSWHMLELECRDSNTIPSTWIGIFLHKTATSDFVRAHPQKLATIDRYDISAGDRAYPPYLQRTRFVTARSITQFDVKRIEHQYYQSLQLCLPRSAVITTISPEDLWDPANNVFLVGSISGFTGYVYFDVEDARGHRRQSCVIAVGNPVDLYSKRAEEGGSTLNLVSRNPPWAYILPRDTPSALSWDTQETTVHNHEPAALSLEHIMRSHQQAHCQTLPSGDRIEASISRTYINGQRAFQVKVEVKAKRKSRCAI